MTITVECERGLDGRWFAEVPQLPGMQAYGPTRAAATEQALSLTYRALEEAMRLGIPRLDADDIYGRRSERLGGSSSPLAAS